MIYPCLILAGGLGTRMSQYTAQIPKALIPVAGKPFIHHQLDLLEAQGFREIFFSIGYLGSDIVNELTQNPHPNLKIEFIEDGPVLMGTGGAVRRIIENQLKSDLLFITYGDSYLQIDPQTIINSFNPIRFEALMTLYSNKDQLDTENARLNDDGSAFYLKGVSEPKISGLNMIDYGISLVSRESLLSRLPHNTVSDLAQYFQEISRLGRLQGLEILNRFYEIGSLAGLKQLDDFLT